METWEGKEQNMGNTSIQQQRQGGETEGVVGKIREPGTLRMLYFEIRRKEKVSGSGLHCQTLGKDCCIGPKGRHLTWSIVRRVRR